MNEIVIKRHSFDLAKNRLKEFSEKTEAELAIDKVKTDGKFFGLGDHKVTGYELNKRLESIQSHLIDINSTNNGTIKEFREVYNALDALDKDYITSILASIKAIEKTSNDVRNQQGTLKQHNEKLASQQNKLDSHQIEIEKNISNVTKIVMTLKSFKEKLDGYKHLTDIDKIWSDCKMIGNEIQEVLEFVNQMGNITHLNDIDCMWDDLSNIKTEIKKIHTKIIDSEEVIQKHQNDLQRLNSESIEYKKVTDTLSQNQIEIGEYVKNNRELITQLQKFRGEVDLLEHLVDVDAMWGQGNVLKTDLADTNNSVISLQQKTSEIENKIADRTKQMQCSVAALEKKLKYAYFVAGGALGLALVQLLLALTGVI